MSVAARVVEAAGGPIGERESSPHTGRGDGGPGGRRHQVPPGQAMLFSRGVVLLQEEPLAGEPAAFFVAAAAALPPLPSQPEVRRRLHLCPMGLLAHMLSHLEKAAASCVCAQSAH